MGFLTLAPAKAGGEMEFLTVRRIGVIRAKEALFAAALDFVAGMPESEDRLLEAARVFVWEQKTARDKRDVWRAKKHGGKL